MLCKICLEQGKVICTKCSQPMPAGYGKSCEACYWQGLLDKRTYINCSAFTSPKMEIHFREFASWLGVKVGTHKAAITLNRYLSLFLDIENKLTGISSYEAMLNSFGAAKLRKYLLPMKWMEESGLIVVDAIAREANTERCRIESLLNKLEAKSKQRQLADGYYQLLKTDLAHNKTTIRSIRLALSPAIHLMLQGAKMSIPIPNQKLLDNYLSKSVGQRSSISGFVCYLRDRQGIEIKLPKLDANKALLNRRRKLESEILALMKADKANAHNREWLCVALEYFHGMPKRVGKTIASENLIYTADGGVVVCWNGLRYWLKAS
ncbi:MAG: hypothetical protein CTY12_04020 [Methylotenera sp.]|nr:MAG: hypothetical protein CTY12_04020 [Methylotenera sp.]